MKTRLFFSFSALLVMAVLFAAASPAPTGDSPTTKQTFFDRLNSQPVIEIKLTFDIQQLLDQKNTDEDHPAVLEYNGLEWETDVSARGRYRRRVCDFPPLKLKVSKDLLRANGLEDHNDLKLVTHCSDDYDSREVLLREQLAYEIYGLMTDQHIRSQVVRITYEDSQSGRRTTRYGLLLEDTDEMAQRLNGEECDDCYNLAQAQFRPGALERLTVFQYLIGNTDWSVTRFRNLKLVKFGDDQRYTAVPYDFDFSGMVSAPYAKPNVNLGQKDIRDRIWQWEYDSATPMQAAVEHALSKEAQVLNLVENYTLLNKAARRDVADYLIAGFDALANSAWQVSATASTQP